MNCVVPTNHARVKQTSATKEHDRLCSCGHYLSDHIEPKGRGSIRGCITCECRSYNQSYFTGGQSIQHSVETKKADTEVVCLKCWKTKRVHFGHCLMNGWPQCHGETMIMRATRANISEETDSLIRKQLGIIQADHAKEAV